MDVLNEINATNYHGSVPIGNTRPFIVNCGNEAYVAKIFDEEFENKHLINEYVCNCLAQFLHVPSPDASLIRMDQSIIDSVPELKERNIKSNLLYGSKLIEPAQPNITPPLLERIKNTDDIPSIILFDQIIYNNDRATNDGNLLINFKEKKIYAIDHSHVFKDGLLWDVHSLDRINSERVYLIDNFHQKYYKMMLRYVKGNDPFSKIKARLSFLTEQDVTYIIDSVPLEWKLLPDDADALKRFILHRINNVNEIFRCIQNQCPQWKGVI
ncbi:HipA family kinase [Sporosarcina koreensis]|uniref:HipA family kinase n=1 Tax=Sporosarcina koreensis TaxID=334735 RepID=UPI00058EADDB|nr:HipA family kinase [Sporosarcina koreensis]